MITNGCISDKTSCQRHRTISLSLYVKNERVSNGFILSSHIEYPKYRKIGKIETTELF